ncbi:MAG: periplasmic heavy metal sensor [Alphaproteobacteria bacterium]|nr:periplasmic heavy metal sensor [Alphaproteobacteria bacterium]
MKKNIAWILLGVSLTANVFFAGGMIYAKGKADSRFGPGFRHHVGERLGGPARLGLSEEQREAFRGLLGEVRGRAEAFRDQMRPTMEAFRAELDRPDPDAGKLADLLLEISDSRHEMQTAIVGEMEVFMTQLEPGQRRLFVQFARRTPIFRILGIGGRGPGRRGPGFGGFREGGQ